MQRNFFIPELFLHLHPMLGETYPDQTTRIIIEKRDLSRNDKRLVIRKKELLAAQRNFQ